MIGIDLSPAMLGLAMARARQLGRDVDSAPITRSRPSRWDGPLSPREREVAALVGDGLSDRQIADRLVITEGTAGVHVGHLPNFCRKPYGPGWALLGDAGYHKDPCLPLGISDALRDAELLAEALDAGLSGRESVEHALAHYEQERNAAALPSYALTRQFAALQAPHRRCSSSSVLWCTTSRKLIDSSVPWLAQSRSQSSLRPNPLAASWPARPSPRRRIDRPESRGAHVNDYANFNRDRIRTLAPAVRCGSPVTGGDHGRCHD